MRDQLINGDPDAFEANIEGYQRQLDDLDDPIAREAAREALWAKQKEPPGGGSFKTCRRAGV